MGLSPLVNSYKFQRAQNSHVAMTTYVNSSTAEIFSRFKGLKGITHFTHTQPNVGQSPIVGQSALVGKLPLVNLKYF